MNKDKCACCGDEVPKGEGFKIPKDLWTRIEQECPELIEMLRARNKYQFHSSAKERVKKIAEKIILAKEDKNLYSAINEMYMEIRPYMKYSNGLNI